MTTAATGPRGFMHRNGLSVVLAVLFLAFWIGQALTGLAAENQERRQHGQAPQSLSAYIVSAGFVSATFENWESEFLQMGVYVLLTGWLYQRGSAESRRLDPHAEEAIEATERKFWHGPTPRFAQAKGWIRWAYEHSLSMALLAMFALSFVAHLLGSWRHYVGQELQDGRPAPQLQEYLWHPQFWFESFQNWQSEFLAVVTLVLLSIVLRQKNSSQSKPVEAPHGSTGS